MIITLNNKKYQLSDQASISLLMEELPPLKPNTVVSVNNRVICSKTWTEHTLKEGDKVVTFDIVGGG